ncbi:hypothetical protein NDU88_000773 [Pleurodeles waltl]|uniref:Uncharacterized protein n=1 Tax=Pleurodeles waltl TaxID=8319 RepID=A0AAV7L7I5_PLEWA|nr:hypothetical protein NDU88_000773 [Pleurodeles waltl]
MGHGLAADEEGCLLRELCALEAWNGGEGACRAGGGDLLIAIVLRRVARRHCGPRVLPDTALLAQGVVGQPLEVSQA